MGSLFTSKQKTKFSDPFKKGTPEYTSAYQALAGLQGRLQDPFTIPGPSPDEISGYLDAPTARTRQSAQDFYGTVNEAQPYTRALFGEGLGQLGRTAAGDYLDVTKVPAFQNLAAGLYGTGQNVFSDLVNSLKGDAARSGVFNSSARLASEEGAAGRVASGIAEQLGQYGAAQYGAERQAQDAAARTGIGLPAELTESLMRMNAGEIDNLLRAFELRYKSAAAPEEVAQTRYQQLLGALGLFKRGDSTTSSTPSIGASLGGILKPSLGS